MSYSMLTGGCLDCNPQDWRIERLATDYKCTREANVGSLKNRLRLEFKKRLTEQAA